MQKKVKADKKLKSRRYRKEEQEDKNDIIIMIIIIITKKHTHKCTKDREKRTREYNRRQR